MTSDAQPAERSAQPSPALSTPIRRRRCRRVRSGGPGRRRWRSGSRCCSRSWAAASGLPPATARPPDQLAQASRLRLLATDLAASLVDAETGQRGFLLTGQPAFLAPFTDAARRLPGEIAALRQATAQQPRTKADMTALGRLVPAKLDELQRTLRLAQSGQRAAALALLATGRGKADMDAIRAVTARMARREERIVAGLVGGINARGTWLVAIDSAGIVLVLGIAVIVGFGLRRAFTGLRDAGAALAAANDRLGQANETLEQTVQARTADLTEANEEIQRFAYIVSHDLRAPLVNVMGFTSELEAANAVVGRYVAELAAQPGQTVPGPVAEAVDEELPEAIGFIKSSTAKMDRLIGAILRLSREGRRVMAPERVDDGRPARRHRRQPRPPGRRAGGRDRDRRRARAGDRPAGGRAGVRQPRRERAEIPRPGRPGRIEIAGRRQGAYAVIEVRDNGRGIAPRDHERIFELFRRAGDQTDPRRGHRPCPCPRPGAPARRAHRLPVHAWAPAPRSGSSFLVAPIAGKGAAA